MIFTAKGECGENHTLEQRLKCKECNSIAMNNQLLQLTLKNAFVRNGHKRVNTLKLKVDKSGALLIYINTGHSRETDKKNYSLFVCELGNIEKLKEFIGALK